MKSSSSPKAPGFLAEVFRSLVEKEESDAADITELGPTLEQIDLEGENIVDWRAFGFCTLSSSNKMQRICKIILKCT